MLTRSPIQPSPVNSSPLTSFHSFHYAPPPSPRRSPSSSRVSASLNRSQSSPSLFGAANPMTAPPTDCPPPPSRRHGSIDTSTQSLAMEPTTASVAAAVTPIEPVQPGVSQTTVPAPIPAGPSGNQPIQPSNREPANASGTTTLATPTPAPPQLSSPNKRRKSHSQQEDPVAPGTTPRPTSPAKRARQEAAPPKVLPQRYELCQVEDIVILVANLLCELIETNDKLALTTGHLTRFHSRTAPGISVLDYLHRLAKHATLSPPLLLSMVYYIDRLFSAYPDFTINTLTVHRFLITAATVAAKGLSDSFWNNSTYARVGGVRVAELNLLELEFLHRVDWRIVPKPEELVAYYRGLVERCEQYALQDEDADSDDDESDSSDELDMSMHA